MRWRRYAMLVGLVANAILWTFESFAQVDQAAGIIETIVGKDTSLGFAGLVISVVLVFVYLDGRNHRTERGEWRASMDLMSKALTSFSNEMAAFRSTLVRLEARLEK